MISQFKEKAEGSYVWIDITNPTKADLGEVAKRFELHPALVEDCLQPDHLPKHETVGDNHFVILRAYNETALRQADTIQEVTDKIAVFLGNDFIVTIHRPPFEFLSKIKGEYVDSGHCSTPYHVLFRVFASVIITYDPPLTELIQRIDTYEPKIFLDKKIHDFMKTIYYMKRRATVIDNVFDLSRTVHENLKGKIPSQDYNHLKDEFTRLTTTTDQVVDNVNNLLHIYISLSNQRSGEVMQVLTLFSVFFMPLTFIVGIYGMNFDVMPELRWFYGYPTIMLIMIAITIFIYFWFRRKGWL